MKKNAYVDLFRQMILIRLVEDQASMLYQQGKIGGFLHLYVGQEAVSTGVVVARQEGDRVITAYRDHGVAINCGIPIKEVLAELLGKVTGCSQGRGGSMHLADVSKNFWGGHAIVGAHLPIAAGLALGDLSKEEGCFFHRSRSSLLFNPPFLGLQGEDPYPQPSCDSVRREDPLLHSQGASAVDPPRGPIDCIVDHLNAHAAPTDRVKIAYGDLPLMFHTRLEIVSSTVVGPPAPEWIIRRHFSPMKEDAAFLPETGRVAPGDPPSGANRSG